jgi:hypothetical protein
MTTLVALGHNDDFGGGLASSVTVYVAGLVGQWLYFQVGAWRHFGRHAAVWQAVCLCLSLASLPTTVTVSSSITSTNPSNTVPTPPPSPLPIVLHIALSDCKVGGYSESDRGPIATRVTFQAPPSNDNFESAAVPGPGTGSSLGASLQDGEPAPVPGAPFGASLWYRYTTPAAPKGKKSFKLTVRPAALPGRCLGLARALLGVGAWCVRCV